MGFPYERPDLISFSTDCAHPGFGRGQCETGPSGLATDCTTGWIAKTTCTSGPWAANAKCNTGTLASSTTNRQCCTGGTPAISNLKCTSGDYAGNTCGAGLNYSQYDCS
jgi:hypothetical protein